MNVMMLWRCTEIAKARATGSNVGSIEELAMHRSLSEYLFQTFSKPNTVETVRKNMIDAALAVDPLPNRNEATAMKLRK